MKEGTRYIEDILLEVGEEEGMSKSEMNDLWNHQMAFVKKQAEKEGVYSIFLPYIGTMTLNVKQVLKEMRKRHKRHYLDLIDKVKKLKKHENYTTYNNAHKRVTAANRLARRIIKNYVTDMDKNTRLLFREECWPLISKYSNKILNKK